MNGSPDGVMKATNTTMPTMAYWRPLTRVRNSRIENLEEDQGDRELSTTPNATIIDDRDSRLEQTREVVATDLGQEVQRSRNAPVGQARPEKNRMRAPKMNSSA